MKLQKAYNFAAFKFRGTCKIIINRDNFYDKIYLIKIFVKKSTLTEAKKKTCKNIGADKFIIFNNKKMRIKNILHLANFFLS